MPLRTNFSRFKEPRAFLKIIQLVIAIFAFSTTAGYSSKFIVNVPCSNKTLNVPIKAEFSYSFGDLDISIDSRECVGFTLLPVPKDLPSTLKSSSQFFVFVGVMAFLYCIAAMVYYVVFEDPAKYGPAGSGRALVSFATVDFVVTLVFALFWFCGSVAWAVGRVKLADETDADDFCTTLDKSVKVPRCKVDDKANYAGITISVLFGFLSCFLWCANIWFVFKETMWHKEPGATATAEQPNSEVPHQQVPKEALP